VITYLLTYLLTYNKQLVTDHTTTVRKWSPMPANQVRLQAPDTVDWTVRCDWLQVPSSCVILYTHNIMLMGAARLVQVLQDSLQV